MPSATDVNKSNAHKASCHWLGISDPCRLQPNPDRGAETVTSFWDGLQEVVAAEAEASKLQVLLEELVQDCEKRSPEAAGDKSIAGHLLRLRDAKGQPLSFSRMVQEFFIFFLAGSETTGHTIAWTL